MDRRLYMTKLWGGEDVAAIERAISLVSAALDECDRQGLVYAAIDISSALDKLNAIKSRIVS
jgi:hypothetical protein